MRKKIIYLLIICIASVLVAGCLDLNPSPQQQPGPQTNPNTTLPEKHVKYAKMEGSFKITSSDFTNNSSKTISKDSNGNEIKWVIEENKTGGNLVISYYGQEVSTNIPKIYYPENKTYSYKFNESGYEIYTSSGRYKDIIIKGEWVL